jgi:hypothetical protein
MVSTIKIGKFADFLKSDAVITTASAILLTPLILGTVTQFGSRIPAVGNRLWIIFLIASIIVFSIASMFSGMIQDIVLGLSIGLAINALLSTSFGAGLLSRISRT